MIGCFRVTVSDVVEARSAVAFGPPWKALAFDHWLTWILISEYIRQQQIIKLPVLAASGPIVGPTLISWQSVHHIHKVRVVQKRSQRRTSAGIIVEVSQYYEVPCKICRSPPLIHDVSDRSGLLEAPCTCFGPSPYHRLEVVNIE